MLAVNISCMTLRQFFPTLQVVGGCRTARQGLYAVLGMPHARFMLQQVIEGPRMQVQRDPLKCFLDCSYLEHCCNGHRRSLCRHTHVALPVEV